MSVAVRTGDCLALMREMPAQSVHCCVTSPPYFGLRSYGIGLENGEIGCEDTPDAYVARLVEVFREVRRVLRDDGTVWLNLGDSYSGSASTSGAGKETAYTGKRELPSKGGDGIKPKDLLGIPWAVAEALRAPYYTGRIKDERNRIWLAAIIDGEGCFFIHKRKAGTSAYSKHVRADGTEASYTRTADTYGVGLEISNTSKRLIDRVADIVPGGTFTTQGPDQNARRKQTIYRWRIAPNETKRLAQELYPHLVAKQDQARLVFSCPSNGAAGAEAHQAMMDLHNGVQTSLDFPAPPSMFEPGWYLRQDIIWGKPNPMPESVEDRCTKAHEYLFLLSKRATYYYDAAAIAEPAETFGRQGSNRGDGVGDKNAAYVSGGMRKAPADRYDAETRNRRSVWTVATQPFSAKSLGLTDVDHFATFPPDLIEPCIKAGTSERGCCPGCGAPWARVVERDDDGTRDARTNARAVAMGHDPRGPTAVSRAGEPRTSRTVDWQPTCACPPAAPVPATVLDPFGGAGTTALVADRLGRSAILCELNPAYAAMARDRLQNDAGLFYEAAE